MASGVTDRLFESPKALTPVPNAEPSQRQRPNLSAKPSQAASNQNRSSVACGMTLLPANPKIDSAMRIPTPSDRRFPMVTMEPTSCRPPAATDAANGQAKQKGSPECGHQSCARTSCVAAKSDLFYFGTSAQSCLRRSASTGGNPVSARRASRFGRNSGSEHSPGDT